MKAVLERLGLRTRPADIAVFHEYHRPPYGGGNQFMLALRKAWRAQGLAVENNRISKATPVCLFNSFNFPFERLRAARREGCRMVHRVDGPVTVYRGTQDDLDAGICRLNSELAETTVFQSQYSLNEHRRLGLEFVNPTVIPNAVDPDIFFPADRPPGAPLNRKIRLISTSWSQNPNKGKATYEWLDAHLDWTRYDYMFMGRAPAEFRNIRVIPAAPSEAVARQLREHDVYLTASLNDPCSNALLEALACGLPAIYAASGGHPELVGGGGLGFSAAEEIPAALDRLLKEYALRRGAIRVPPLADVAGSYLAVMGLDAAARG